MGGFFKFAYIEDGKVVELYNNHYSRDLLANNSVDIPENQFVYIGMKYYDGEFIAEGAEREIYAKDLKRSEYMRSIGVSDQLEAVMDFLIFDDDTKLKVLKQKINSIKLNYKEGE